LGDFQHVAPYIRYFNSAGHDVSFIALSPAPDYSVKTYNAGFGKKYSRTKGKWKYPFSMIRAKKLVRKIKPDIVHTHYATSGGLTGLVCGFHPTITTVHGSDLNLRIHSRTWRHLLRMVFDHADCVNTCTQEQKSRVIALGITPAKIRVLTLGIDTQMFSLAKRHQISSARPLKLVTTRSLESIYDHSTIVKALDLLRAKEVDFEMTFVAGGSLLGQLKQQTEAKGLSANVNFLGGVEKSRIVEILHNSDVFLSAAIFDGISVALLEAMATGLFPIVTDISAYSAWISDEVNGFLYNVGDADGLANCILKIYKNDQWIKNSAKANQQKVVKFADTNTNMAKLEKIYEELIQSRRNDIETARFDYY
jgi:glycosyltransferase involved in cell wall biosynthesis